MSGGREAWTRYWSGSGAGAGAGCLPNAGPLEAVQKQVWQRFAERLPRGARLLDLATGNGVVLGWIAELRRDLKLVGVDSAAALPPPPKGIQLKAGVPIEALPFAERSFDAATSQFGIEYCDSAKAAAELARVLKPGAPVQLVVHHRDSPILRHNLARLEALRWAAGPNGLIAKGKGFAAASPFLPVPPLFRSAPGEAQRLYPDQPVAAEIATGLLQRLTIGRGRGDAPALVAALEAEAADEIGRIEALARAARDEAGIGALAAELAAAGIEPDAPEPLWGPHNCELAWLLSGRR